SAQNSDIYKNFGALKNQWNRDCSLCDYLMYCSGDCIKHRIYGNNPPTKLSWLCNGYKRFFDHTISTFENLAREFHARNNIQDKLFLDQKLGRNDICFCGSGKKYKKCHG
ncbi:MAG: anaerobic sulfatase maturase, partial [Clostridiales bacterium]|nr:anaerobic sulfatase maturase [Clostridiales bacterium]